MPSFRKASKQSEHMVKQHQQLGTTRHGNNKAGIHSLGTMRNYTQALTQVCEWLSSNKLGSLRYLTVEKAVEYLEIRGQIVKQKTLNQERQAMQMVLGEKLPVIKSELTEVTRSRAYTTEQIELIIEAQTEKYRLSTQIAAHCGLRAHELLTLRKVSEQPASKHRKWSENRFLGREGERYTVVGKGGLIREVLIPHHLASQLEAKRLAAPNRVIDRGIYYNQYYDIGGGHKWSRSVSSASTRQLGWSNGAHGLRHTYAQQRMEELQQRGKLYQEALSIVSQNLGHFRPSITEVYLK